MIHDDLLEIADDLARREKAGRPKQASLRRAISTAYYAVFHALAYLCADRLVGWKKSWEVFTPIYRALDHSAAKKLFVQDRNGDTYGKDVAEIGRIFILLQQERNAADYDPEFTSSREKTLELIRLARQAVEATLTLNADKQLLLAVHLVRRQR
jgi:uncharacterized protein (UPF0332 family)